jgi:hypothetical protein
MTSRRMPRAGVVPARPASFAMSCMAICVAKLEQEPSFARWFAELEGDVQQVAADPSPRYDRLITLQHALIDLIDFLDDPPTRFPQKHRVKL